MTKSVFVRRNQLPEKDNAGRRRTKALGFVNPEKRLCDVEYSVSSQNKKYCQNYYMKE